MARKDKPVIPEPRAGDFDIQSEWEYAMSVWHESEGRIAYANLHMQRAIYHQQRDHQIESRRPKKLKRGSAANSVGMSRDEEFPYHQAHGDAVAMSKNLYERSRARSPLKHEMPKWEELSRGAQDQTINDVKYAVSILDERRAFRREQTNGS